MSYLLAGAEESAGAAEDAIADEDAGAEESTGAADSGAEESAGGAAFLQAARPKAATAASASAMETDFFMISLQENSASRTSRLTKM